MKKYTFGAAMALALPLFVHGGVTRNVTLYDIESMLNRHLQECQSYEAEIDYLSQRIDTNARECRNNGTLRETSIMLTNIQERLTIIISAVERLHQFFYGMGHEDGVDSADAVRLYAQDLKEQLQIIRDRLVSQ